MSYNQVVPLRGRSAAEAVSRYIRRESTHPPPAQSWAGARERVWGLSLYNYLSAELEVMMLRYAFRNDNIKQHLIHSLPIAGVDGTLKKRMKSGSVHGNVKAKTGTLTGIISLAGYCTAANGHELCFSIINNGIMHGSNARHFADKVCNLLCQP